jgi:glutamyl-tRNA synthetase
MHPSYPERGYREIRLEPVNGRVEVFISRSDFEKLCVKSIVRLMELVNLEIVDKRDDVAITRIHSKDLESARKVNAPIIQWVPTDGVPITVKRPEGLKLIEDRGLAEQSITQVGVGEIVQFMRYGFVKKTGNNEFVYVHD